MNTRAVVAVAAGVLTAVGNAPAAHAAENGALVFEAGDPATQTEQVYRVGPGGGALTQLTRAQFQGDWNECPSWSPSGQRVWYDKADRLDETAPQVFRARANGERPTKISQNAMVYSACPDVSPNGRNVAFLRYVSSSENARIGIMKSDGSDVKTLLKSGKASYFAPRYSPDGKWLSLVRETYTRSGGIKAADVMLLRLKTRELVNLTKQHDSDFSVGGWDPNGKGVLAVQGERKIVRLFVDGSDSRPVAKVRGNAYVASPVFAPDRSRIAYLMCADGDCGDPLQPSGIGSIWKVKKNGEAAKRILLGSRTTLLPANQLDWGVAP